MTDIKRLHISVFIIGFYPLEAQAFAALLDDYCKVYISDEVSENEAGKLSVFLTTPVFFLQHLDFFMPRKSRTILYTEDKSKLYPSPVITKYDDLQYLLKLLNKFTTRDNEASGDENSLTSRESDVLKEIASGKTNKEIAEELNISVNTVITHRKNITQKLGIRSASGLSLYALMNGLI